MADISHYPQRNGIIYGFCSGDPYFIGDVMGDLRLESPVEFWLYVSHRMKELKMSEPTVDLIILLDMLRSNMARSKRLVQRIGEFSCDDEIQMQTYSDLISKHYAANPGAEGPVDTEKLMSASKNYLACCDIEAEVDDIFVSAKGEAKRKALEGGFRVTEERRLGDISLVFGEKLPAQKDKINDLICLIRSVGAENDGSVLDFLSDEAVCSSVKRVKRIESGLLHTLLTFSCGLDINVYRTDGLKYPLAEICTGYRGCWLARIAPADLYTLQMTGANRGISVSPVARVKKGKMLNFSFPGGAYRINSDFIFEITSSPYDSAVSIAEPSPLTRPSFDDVTYVESGDGCYLSDKINTGCAYFDAASAVISAVSKAVACGYDLRGICLTNLITYDENHASGEYKLPSELVSHTLGLYRAQMELCLPDTGCALEGGDANKLTVIANTSGKRQETCVDGGTVYLATPALSEEGFPRYGELRGIFRFVFGAVTTGKCKAEVIDARGAQNALLRLCGDTSIDVSKVRFVPGSFLLLTKEKIEGLEILGSLGGDPRSMVED